MKFSIIVILYNQANYINETIESILKQTYQNFEIIISDDCSTDNTLDIIKNIKDPRLKYVKTQYNMGINANINNACKYVSGDLVVILGGDDKLRPNHLEKMHEVFSNNNIDVAYCQLTNIDKNGKYITGKDIPCWFTENKTHIQFLHDFFTMNCLNSPGMTLKYSAMASLLPMNLSIVNYSDVKMHIDLLINGFKLYVLNDILVDYRQFKDHRNISGANNGLTYKRILLETKPLMDSYLKIKDIELLQDVFKEEINQSRIKPYPEAIPFFLGQMALLQKDEARQTWGYQLIAEFISKKDNYDIVHKLYNFTFKDLLNLSKKIKTEDDFTIKIYKKYETYKKLFNIFILVSIILLLCLLYFYIKFYFL